ncbi:hypothetical protein ACOSQ4_015130 [Xanthoceras sorbifolium]
MGEKEKDSRLRPGPGACGVGLKGLGERGSIESGSSVGLGVEAQGGNYGGEGVNLGVKSVTSLGHGVGAQSVDMGSFYEKETRIVLSSSGPEFMKMVDMEGVELDVGDALVCVDTIDGPSGVQMVKKIDPKEKSTMLRSFQGLDVLDILCGVSSVISRDQLARFVIILWCLWWNRNAALHGGFGRDAYLFIVGLWIFWLNFRGLRLNLDVAIHCGSGFIGVGVAIRDSAKDIVAVVSKLLPSFFSAELGEFLILREGLVLAKSLNLSISVAEDDASNIASTVNSSSPFCSDASFIISDIKALCKEVGS